ncbi:MAG: PKD domain-containing protein [Bacteroidia bacterium]|nr:PKD domain-containing protein [Bacteroidia bacterium]
MKNQLHFWLICFFLCISSYAFSSHIVGGTLTYIRNPNATYTITLKLYRDCSPNPNKAPFDASVTITVLGYNGALFSPTRDITMSLAAINPVPPILPPCAIAPNPIPCVQEGIYTKIVTLPPNPGGYHLYWQRAARNVAINNCRVDPTNCLCLWFPCGYSCVGSSFDADIPGETVIWGEDFKLPNNSTSDTGPTSWSIAAVGTFPPPASAWVNTLANNNKVFEITGASNAQKTWTSQSIPISSCPSVNLRVDLSQTGNFLPFDSLFVYYRLNGGPLTLFPTNGIKSGNFISAVASKTGISGSTVQIIIRAHFGPANNFGSKKFQLDNVLVSCSDFVPNSNPVFNLFPPIFLCAGQPFTFDHSATDANGDSLVYSLYTPYNGENGPSYTLTLPPATLDPTFSGNTAVFTPIVWLPGYSVANPLGGPPLILDPSTGMLSGTPPMIGKFVVGVKVKEYRNGVYISQTLRDFQFNVVNCPSPPLPVTGTNIIVNQGCVGQIAANGYIDSTVIWNSVYPGTYGAYNNYLSCSSGCINPTATGQPGLPPYIDFQICGMSASCNPIYICDTVRVTFHTTLFANIVPQNPAICIGQTNTTITANGSGGTPPYTYLWNNINPSQSILVGTGTYTVRISDASNCPPSYASVTVTSYAVAVAANAGPDKTACKQTPITIINGSVAGASGGSWSGGGGAFSPNNTTLSGATYSPTVAELAAGFADLTLTTTGSGTCPAVSDIVRINYINFAGIVSFTKTPVSCFGGSDGSASVNVAGGTPTYTYSWNTVPAQSTATATNLSQGTYSVTTTNGIGCTSTDPVTIIQPSPIALASSITDVSCSAGSNGSISITPSGGTGPYTYLWQPGNQTTSSINGKPAGTYTITVTDSKACQKTSPYQIAQPSAIAILLTAIPVNCFGGNTGTASSTVTGGTSPYTYNWNSGATSPDASGLPAGTFTLTVTDNKGCLKSNSVTITQPTALIASTLITNETCNYLDNGTATAGSSGGTPGYTYLWSNGVTSSQITNLTSQIYTLTVTDSVGCTATAFATITETALLTINFISQVNVSCFAGNDGIVTASPVGGIPNYTYLWAPGGATTATKTNLSMGSYTVAVTDSKGCVTTDSVTITQPLAPLSVSVSALPATCYGGNDGSVSASAANGTGPYTYIWTPGNLTGQNIANLNAGTYTVTAADSKGCLITNSDTITQPTQIVLTTSGVNSDCGQPNGQTSVVVTGGTSPYTYLWSPTGGTNATAPGLISGAYTVVVTDSTGCSATQFGNVDENSAPTASIYSVINVSCYGGSDGSAKVATSGGIGPFTYSWMPSGGTDSIATGLAAGSYTVTVSGTNGCKALATINPGITQPLPILINVTKTTVSCFGGNDGTASAIASSGTPGYTYKWLPSGTTGASITNLSAGTYTIEVTDNNNCVQTMPVIIIEPGQVSAIISSTTNVKCLGEYNGTATAIVSGGTPVYNYNWMPWGGNGPIGTGLSAGTYTVSVTDIKGCIDTSSVTITEPSQALSATSIVSSGTCFGASNAAVGIHPAGGTPIYSFQWTPSVSLNDTASGLAPGNYTITVTDYNSCKANLSVSISEPSEINGTLITINPACGLSNGSISSQVSGGTFPYTYLWSLGAATTSALTGLGTGVYNLLVTDASGCTKSLSANLTIAPGPSIAFSSINNVSCNGGSDGSATITITQGLAPYIINWSPSGGNSLTASGFSIGTYTVTVTDALGCEISDSVIITEPTPVDVSVSSITDVLCNGGNTGTISVAPTGGTGPLYTYLWVPGGSTLNTAYGLTMGTYTVTVMDQNNCAKAISASITQPTLLSASVDTIIDAVCYGGLGSATILASGGVLPYSYSWSAPASGQTGSEVNNVGAASYTVTVTDTNGCFTTIDVLIKQPIQVITQALANDTLCLGQTGSLSATAIGGAGNYYYAWQPSGAITSGTLPITPTSNTTYTVVAFDQIGCAGTPDSVTAIVYNLDGGNVQVFGTSPICPGQSSFVYAETSGTTGPLTYQWNNNLGTAPGGYLVTPSQPTTYIVTVSNMCGLNIADSVEVLFIPQPTITLSSDTNALCIPGSMSFFDNSLTGNLDDPITMWNWNFGDGTTSIEEDPEHNYDQSGTYQVTLVVSTSGGCSNNNSSAPITINAHPIPTAAFTVNSTNLALPVDELILNNHSTGANSYYWDFGDGSTSTLLNPQYLYNSVGVFQVQLIAMSQFGCLDTAFAEVTTNADLIFPNVFTPNPNGASGGSYDINSMDNDVFFPYVSGVIEFKIEIFNRWGEEIFESLDIKKGWDGYYRGQICQQDVYIWKAYIKLNNGKIFHKNGDVTILSY